jgi:5-methylcytosine-specific restriction enzyme subunit McrC
MSSEIKIPIQNIYYLLCYAWNKLDEKDVIDISGIDTTSILDLFSKVLIGGLSHIIRQGLDRGYVNISENTKCLKGKICFSQTIKQNLLIKAEANCDYDELSYNVIHNQILKATIRLLITEETLDKTLKYQLIGFYRKLQEIDDIKLNHRVLSYVQLHRNISFYDFLLKICELVYDNLLVSEDPGKSKFRDFLQDEKQMAYLFEEFVRNFYKIEAHDYKVSREDIAWQAIALDDISAKYLPKMETDISIEKDRCKVVMDTKYYKKALVAHRDRGQEKIRSNHLMQLHAYLSNLAALGGINRDCSGVLLYPTVDQDWTLNYMFGNHKVMVRTINLNQNWKEIHNNLFDILEQSLAPIP